MPPFQIRALAVFCLPDPGVPHPPRSPGRPTIPQPPRPTDCPSGSFCEPNRMTRARLELLDIRELEELRNDIRRLSDMTLRVEIQMPVELLADVSADLQRTMQT